MKIAKFFISASLMLLSVGLYAQSQGERPHRPKMKTPEEIARITADKMKSEVCLTDKQYKKVYKLIKKDQEYRRSQAENAFGGGRPPQGGPGMGGPGGGMMGGGPGGMGGGMMGGGPGGMGGGMMGGGPGGMGGDMPSRGEMGDRGSRPNGAPGMRPGEELVTEEYLEKQEKKLRKILSEDQYTRWRSNHPAEHQQLPPMEFKN